MDCPICDKKGLSGNETHCPQCESDLTGFHIIKAVDHYQKSIEIDLTKAKEAENRNKRSLRNIYTISALIVIILFTTVIWLTTDKNNKLDAVKAHYQAENDSIVNLLNTNRELVNKLEQKNDSLKNDQKYVRYIVRSGDNLTKVAQLFYGKSSLYVNIMKDNALTENEILYPGDTIMIKLKN